MYHGAPPIWGVGLLGLLRFGCFGLVGLGWLGFMTSQGLQSLEPFKPTIQLTGELHHSRGFLKWLAAEAVSESITDSRSCELGIKTS